MEPTQLFVVAVAVVTVLLLLSIATLFALAKILERTTHILPIKEQQEKIVDDITFITETIQMDMSMMEMGDGETTYAAFSSEDGKFSANTVEELLEKMAIGGILKADDTETNILLNFFNDASKAIDDAGDMWEEDTEDDDKESWK
jgi:hypothetical protein